MYFLILIFYKVFTQQKKYININKHKKIVLLLS